MRGLTPYLIAGALTALALDAFAPQLGYGIQLSSWPELATQGQVVEAQTVNRTGKADRMDVPMNVLARQAEPAQPAPAFVERAPGGRLAAQTVRPQRVLEGCEPSFSPLSAAAYAANNQARRCAT